MFGLTGATQPDMASGQAERTRMWSHKSVRACTVYLYLYLYLYPHLYLYLYLHLYLAKPCMPNASPMITVSGRRLTE